MFFYIGHVPDNCCRNAASTQYIKDLKPESAHCNVHLESNCTTQDVYIANEVEPTGRCGTHNRAPV